MREMEEVHRQREAEKAASLQQRLSRSIASLPHRSIEPFCGFDLKNRNLYFNKRDLNKRKDKEKS